MRVQTKLSNCWIRSWEPDDKLDLARNANNRKIWLNLTDMFPHPYTEIDAEIWIQAANEPTLNTHLAIEFEGIAVGGIGIIPDDGVCCKTGDFGYWIGEPFWGKGIATAAAEAMVDYAFLNLPFARLQAGVFAWNPPSMRVLEKVGFVREGVLKQSRYKDGQLIDSVMYALIKEEVVDLKQKIVNQPTENNWMDKLVGSISDEDAFVEALDYGCSVRQSDRYSS
jgi:[ribosomal protein S5]-alanine N-acetyltransferase